jgi:hypothetical protein
MSCNYNLLILLFVYVLLNCFYILCLHGNHVAFSLVIFVVANHGFFKVGCSVRIVHSVPLNGFFPIVLCR